MPTRLSKLLHFYTSWLSSLSAYFVQCQQKGYFKHSLSISSHLNKIFSCQNIIWKIIFAFKRKKDQKSFYVPLSFWEIAASKKSLTFSLSVAEGDENMYRPICLKQMMSLCIPTYRSRINLMQTEHTCLGWTSCLYLPKEVMIIKSTPEDTCLFIAPQIEWYQLWSSFD